MHIITANRLIDGEVVWLASGERWVESVEAADSYDTKTDLAEGLDRAQVSVADRVVVDPYEVAVDRKNGCLTPVRFREKIRALGPTVRLDLGKQARMRHSTAA